jgi:hypothetical protein
MIPARYAPLNRSSRRLGVKRIRWLARSSENRNVNGLFIGTEAGSSWAVALVLVRKVMRLTAMPATRFAPQHRRPRGYIGGLVSVGLGNTENTHKKTVDAILSV